MRRWLQSPYIKRRYIIIKKPSRNLLGNLPGNNTGQQQDVNIWRRAHQKVANNPLMNKWNTLSVNKMFVVLVSDAVSPLLSSAAYVVIRSLESRASGKENQTQSNTRDKTNRRIFRKLSIQRRIQFKKTKKELVFNCWTNSGWWRPFMYICFYFLTNNLLRFQIFRRLEI